MAESFTTRLIQRLQIEQKKNDHGGVYAFAQRTLAYHSNRIEGSTLTEKQMASLFDTGTLTSEDALFRVNHRSWWKEELPKADEYRTARKTLNQAEWDVDYIITHCCPSSVQDTFSRGLYQRDALTDFFDEVRERCRFQYWFFGHYHENMVVERRFVMLYEQMLRLK